MLLSMLNTLNVQAVFPSGEVRYRRRSGIIENPVAKANGQHRQAQDAIRFCNKFQHTKAPAHDLMQKENIFPTPKTQAHCPLRAHVACAGAALTSPLQPLMIKGKSRGFTEAEPLTEKEAEPWLV